MPSAPAMLGLALVPLLAACAPEGPHDKPSATPSDRPAATGSYAVDPQTGETSAFLRNAQGTTIMRSGEKVPVALPLGFSLYPAARVIGTTRVESGEKRSVLLTMESADSPAELADYYRRQAEAAGIAVEVVIPAGGARTLAGRSADGWHFSLHARPLDGAGSDRRTRAELALRRTR